MLGAHAGPVNTAIVSGLTFRKVTPVDVARQILNALEAGRDEVLVDDMTRQVKAGLSDEQGIYLNFDPEAALPAANSHSGQNTVERNSGRLSRSIARRFLKRQRGAVHGEIRRKGSTRYGRQ